MPTKEAHGCSCRELIDQRTASWAASAFLVKDRGILAQHQRITGPANAQTAAPRSTVGSGTSNTGTRAREATSCVVARGP